MNDIFTKAKRSEVMSRIKGAGNKDTELRLIGIFKTHGITGWRVLRIWEHELAKKNARRLAGRLRRAGLLPRLCV